MSTARILWRPPQEVSISEVPTAFRVSDDGRFSLLIWRAPGEVGFRYRALDMHRASNGATFTEIPLSQASRSLAGALAHVEAYAHRLAAAHPARLFCLAALHRANDILNVPVDDPLRTVWIRFELWMGHGIFDPFARGAIR